MSEFIAKAGDKTIEVYQSKPFDKREKWALETLAKELETILEGFTEGEQSAIRTKLGNYTFGYLGLSYGLHCK